MLLLERESETVDDGAENLKKLCNAIEAFGFVGKLEKHIIDRSTNIRTEVEEFSVDSVKGGF